MKLQPRPRKRANLSADTSRHCQQRTTNAEDGLQGAEAHRTGGCRRENPSAPCSPLRRLEAREAGSRPAVVSTGGPHTAPTRGKARGWTWRVGDGVSGSRKPPEQAGSLCIAVVPPQSGHAGSHPSLSEILCLKSL